MAQLKEIRKVSPGKYLAKYELEYETKDGGRKAYEMVSHNHDLQIETIGKEKTGVVLVVFDPSHEHMLLGIEFRMGVNCHIINNISGFIDPGESVRQAAVRELREETGLELTRLLDVLPFAYTCAPVTDMATSLVICEAEGDLKFSDNPNEEIIPAWYSKGELRAMLHASCYKFSGRTQAIAWMWSKPVEV